MIALLWPTTLVHTKVAAEVELVYSKVATKVERFYLGIAEYLMV